MINAGNIQTRQFQLNIQLKTWRTRGVAINYELLYRCDFNQKLYAERKR